MRPAVFTSIAIALILACDSSDLEVQPATIQWLEWPAEVLVATPFEARMMLIPPVCFPYTFKPGMTRDESAVTFASYFLVQRTTPICPPTEGAFAPNPNIVLDTLLTVLGLAASSPRTFEMRASASVEPPVPPPGAGESPVRTFGDVTVRLSSPDTSRRNAAGRVTLRIDDQGCARVQPDGYFNPEAGFVLEDQADTVGLGFAFVRGYLHDVTTPVCGQTRVFHLLSRN